MGQSGERLSHDCSSPGQPGESGWRMCSRCPRVCFVPVTDDAPALWDTWVGLGGEGIVLKERTSA